MSDSVHFDICFTSIELKLRLLWAQPSAGPYRNMLLGYSTSHGAQKYQYGAIVGR